tara:strand:- start:3444 stop:4703 length:1260 start_codon:yes stop_codon:yes gene_type:complete
VTYLELFRGNRDFRHLFIANWVSNLGDWFSVIALFILAGEQSDGSPLAIAAVIIFRMLGMAIVEPFTGLLADRFSRKKLMILSNFISLSILLIFVYFDLLNSLIMIYIMAFAIMLSRAIYDPARYAYLPNITTREELLTANAVASLGWSAALGFGASLGGFSIASYGVETSLMIDASTFIMSILILTSLPEGGPYQNEINNKQDRRVLAGILEGWNIILTRPEIFRIILAKGMWSVGGGAQIFLLILIGSEAGFGTVATGIGVLYMARGWGSGIGPAVARWVFPKRSKWPSILPFMVMTSGLFYILVGLVQWNNLIIILIFISHATSGANWVFSTTIIQERSSDEWRGRAAGADFMLMSLTSGLSALLAALMLEYKIFDLRETIILTASMQLIAGLMWMKLALPEEKKWIRGNAASIES